jgi:hypothetical protein
MIIIPTDSHRSSLGCKMLLMQSTTAFQRLIVIKHSHVSRLLLKMAQQHRRSSNPRRLVSLRTGAGMRPGSHPRARKSDYVYGYTYAYKDTAYHAWKTSPYSGTIRRATDETAYLNLMVSSSIWCLYATANSQGTIIENGKDGRTTGT